MNAFIKATKNKFRFEFSKGSLTTEDLWDLKLEDLDRIAVSLDEATQKNQRKSFLEHKRSPSSDAADKLEVVVEIIKLRQEALEASKTAAARRAEREFLKTVLERKKTEEVMGMSPEDIKKRLEDLGEG